MLLAGTFEARQLAERLKQAFPGLRITVSFAGAVKDLPALDLPTRVGGFGGVEGLCAYLRAEQVTLVIDATHPFAAQMSRNATKACQQLAQPLIRLDRPPWPVQDGDQWIEVETMAAAASALPAGAKAFLGIGRKEIGQFTQRTDLSALVRMIEPPSVPLPARWDLVLARPPRSAQDECALFRHHGITHVVTKNSGGTRAYAKIDAARMLNVPVIMINRPQLPETRTVSSLQDMLAQVEKELARNA